MKRLAVHLLAIILAIILCGCGSANVSIVSNGGLTVSVTTSSTSATVVAGASQTFTATVSGSSNTGVTWSIQEGAAGGTIDATGKYTAPTTPGTYHIIATSMADSTKSVTITVTVTAPPGAVSISVSPVSANVVTGASQQFTATVANTSNTTVTWSVQEGSGGGTVDAGGKYTAPKTPGAYHVVATSVADPSKSAVAIVTVTLAPNPVSISISPSPAYLFQAQVQQFVASFAGTTNTGVSWVIAEGSTGGTIDNSGKYTAPNTSGTFHVVGTSAADPTKSSIATVNVQGPLITLSITCSVCITTATSGSIHVEIRPNSQLQFTAPVTGTSNTAVNWSASTPGGGTSDGTIDANGLFTAGSSPGQVTVEAQSVANPTAYLFASVTITDSPQLPNLTLLPSNVNILAGATQQFVAPLQWVSVQMPTPLALLNVTRIWSVQEGPAGGTIDANGVYSAPQALGTFHVVVTLPTLNITATSTVNVLGFQTGSFSSSIPTGSWMLSGLPPIYGVSLVQLSDSSVLSVGGLPSCISPKSCPPFNSTGYFYLDSQGNLLDSQVGNLNDYRIYAATARLQDGRVLVAGRTPIACATSAELYDPSTKTFAYTGSMSVPLGEARAVTLQDGTVLVFGSNYGCDLSLNPPPPTSTAEVYSPKTGTFGGVIPISPYRNRPAVALLPDGRVLMAGGFSQDSYPQAAIATAILFDPKTQTFTPTGSMAVAREGAATALLPDGTVLVAGGWDSTSNLTSAEIYDPKSGMFTSAGNMPLSISTGGAFLMPNGKVLLVGAGRITLLYDPQTHSFSFAAETAVAHAGRGLFLMPNGTIMITDGPTDTFEFYHP